MTTQAMRSALTIASLPVLAMFSTPASAGETLPKGPPWHVTYRAAKREALRLGRPVFVYFTKTV